MVTRAVPAAQGSALSDATRDKILTYIRERFGVPDTVKLTLGALHASAVAPDFNEATVTVDDGKNQQRATGVGFQGLALPDRGHGQHFELHQNSAAEMEQRIREVFKTPANVKLSVGGFKPSPSPDFEQGTLTMDDGKSPKQDVRCASQPGWQTFDFERSVQFDRSIPSSKRCAPFRSTTSPRRDPPTPP